MGRYYERKLDGSLGDSFAVQQEPPAEYLEDNHPDVIAQQTALANVVPQEVWAGAMMRALSVLDIQDQVEAIVAASNDWLMQKLWNRAAAFRRDDPMIAAVGMAAGWTEKDLDDLFRLAGSFNK